MNKVFLSLSFLMGLVVLASNYLVQFPIKYYGLQDILTYGAFSCLLYTSDAADDLLCVDLGGRRIIKKKLSKKIYCLLYTSPSPRDS